MISNFLAYEVAKHAWIDIYPAATPHCSDLHATVSILFDLESA